MNAKEMMSNMNKIKLMAVDADEQTRRIEAAVARRAYEIFERRGGMGWHELEDWRKAESDVQSKLCFSLNTADGSFRVGFDAARFEAGSVEVWTAPRQVTICGKPVPHKRQSEKAAPAYEGIVFRRIALRVEVEPCRAVANVKRNFVEIRLPLIQQAYGQGSTAQAA